MKDLLKEAIADAKAVRETALANAKLALEEAFAPRIQSMISAHLQQEADEMDEMDEDEMTAMGDSEAPAEEEMPAEEMPAEEMPAEEPAPAPEEPAMDEEEDMDLEEIIRELEMSEEDEKMDEEDSMPGEEDMKEGESEDEHMSEGDGEEEIDIQEVIRALREEDEEEKVEEGEEEKEEMKNELAEAYNVIKFLRSKINEVNLLNAKLLYSNKLFRTYSLNESQKLKVIENFDRAQNLREVKLLYTALAENFTGNKNKKVVKESFASKPVASTKPAAKTVLNEGDELANRFKKLAGLIK